MEVKGKMFQEVTINPENIVEQLLYEELIYWGNWEKEVEGKYFIMEEKSAGQHSFDSIACEIDKDRFDQIKRLRKCLNYLKNKNKNKNESTTFN